MMNDLNELMKQLQALEAAVADAQPPPSPPVSTPSAPAGGLPPEVYAQLRALQQGAARPVTLPDNLATFDPRKLEQALRGEIQLVNEKVASLHSQFQTLAIAMQAMVREVSAVLEEAMKARQLPSRRRPPPLPPLVRSSAEADDGWEQAQTRVDIPVLASAVDEGGASPLANEPGALVLPDDDTQVSSVFRPTSNAPDGGRVLYPSAGGDLTK